MKNKIIVILSTVAFFTFIIIIIACKDLIFPHSTNSVSFWAFDTSVTINIYDEKKPQKHLEYIKKEFVLLSNECDDYKGDLYILNTEREIDSKYYLADIINEALLLKEKTNGYFNPLMGRLTHLYKENYSSVTDEIISEELEIVNNSKIEVSNSGHIKLIGDANIDLGAITKGYATQLAKKYLEDNGIKKYLINSGESSISVGSKTHNIGLLKPLDSKRDYYKKIKLNNIGISTSAVSYQKYHLISPITGRQENYYKSVSVISDNDMNNDVYSTAIFSMNEEILKSFSKENKINVYAYVEENNIIYVEEI